MQGLVTSIPTLARGVRRYAAIYAEKHKQGQLRSGRKIPISKPTSVRRQSCTTRFATSIIAGKSAHLLALAQRRSCLCKANSPAATGKHARSRHVQMPAAL
jgi:hypothetical protein